MLNAATVCTLWPVTKNLYILWLLVQMANFWHQEVLTNVFIFGAQTLENLCIVTKGQEVYLKFVGTAVETKSAPQLQMELFLSWIWENHKRIQDKSRTIQDLSWIIPGLTVAPIHARTQGILEGCSASAALKNNNKNNRLLQKHYSTYYSFLSAHDVNLRTTLRWILELYSDTSYYKQNVWYCIKFFEMHWIHDSVKIFFSKHQKKVIFVLKLLNSRTWKTQ